MTDHPLYVSRPKATNLPSQGLSTWPAVTDDRLESPVSAPARVVAKASRGASAAVRKVTNSRPVQAVRQLLPVRAVRSAERRLEAFGESSTSRMLSRFNVNTAPGPDARGVSGRYAARDAGQGVSTHSTEPTRSARSKSSTAAPSPERSGDRAEVRAAAATPAAPEAPTARRSPVAAAAAGDDRSDRTPVEARTAPGARPAADSHAGDAQAAAGQQRQAAAAAPRATAPTQDGARELAQRAPEAQKGETQKVDTNGAGVQAPRVAAVQGDAPAAGTRSTGAVHTAPTEQAPARTPKLAGDAVQSDGPSARTTPAVDTDRTPAADTNHTPAAAPAHLLDTPGETTSKPRTTDTPTTNAYADAAAARRNDAAPSDVEVHGEDLQHDALHGPGQPLDTDAARGPEHARPVVSHDPATGARTLTHADGETRIDKPKPGATAEQRLPDGSTVTVHDDGTVTVVRKSGITTAHPDHSVTETWKRSKQADVHALPDADNETTSPRPSVHVTTSVSGDGTVTIAHADGTLTVARPHDGSIETIDREGVKRATDASGVTTTTDPRLTATATPDGSLSATAPSRGTVTTHADGTHSAIAQDGTVVKRTATGETHITRADGSTTILDGNGNTTQGGHDSVRVTDQGEIEVEHSDGSRTVVASDHIRHDTPAGSSTAHADGRIHLDHPDGTATRIAPDGTSYHVDAHGNPEVKGDPRLSSDGHHNTDSLNSTTRPNQSETGLTHNGKLLVDPEEIRNGIFPPDSYQAKLQAAIGTHDNPGPVMVEPDGTLRLRETVDHDFKTNTHTGEYSRQVRMQERQVRDMTYKELDGNRRVRRAWEEHRELIREQNKKLAPGEKGKPVPPEWGTPETEAYREDVIDLRAKKLQNLDAIDLRTEELQQQAKDLGGHLTHEQARAAAVNEYRNLAALHGPDRIVGGYKDLFTGLGDGPINSALGAHWRTELRKFDRAILASLRRSEIDPDLWGDIKLNVRFTVNGKVW